MAIGSWRDLNGGARRWLALGLGLGLVGGLAWLARWLLQGETIIYSDTARAFWVPDSTLGWIETKDRWVWLGLDGLAIVAAVVLGTAVVLHLGLRLGRGEGRWPAMGNVLRKLALVGAGVAMLAPVMPAWAFSSGMPPVGAMRLLPEAPVPPPMDVAPATPVAPLAVRAGKWVVLDVPATLVVARIAAGGETFDGKFGPVTGALQIDPAALAKTSGQITVPSAVDTGVPLRNGHAAGYLEVDKFPSITLSIDSVTDVRQGAAGLELNASGKVALMGRSIVAQMTGSVVALDAAKRAELNVNAAEALLVNVTFKLAIADTTLKRENFDADTLTLTGRLVLVPGGN